MSLVSVARVDGDGDCMVLFYYFVDSSKVFLTVEEVVVL
jgi:hypothetical protein